MSVEMGRLSAQYVYPSEDGMNGISRSAITLLRADYENSDGQFEGLTTSLDVVASGSRQDLKTLHGDTKFLIGVYDSWGHGEPPVGLFYGEGEGKQGVSFSLLRMGLWVNQSRADAAELDEAEIKSELVNFCINPEAESEDKDFIWGVPVTRATVIVDLADGSSQTYGQMQDVMTVSNLAEDLPEDLFANLNAAVLAYHAQPTE